MNPFRNNPDVLYVVSPLGFTMKGKNGEELNYNYYGSKKLMEAVNDQD